jgi:lipopolysaccharide/colanic/teichoic acid biosynthesis glycosyltransferase
MADPSMRQVDYKIAPPESLSIIGSQSITTSRDVFILELDSIVNVHNLRIKRFYDIVFSLFSLLFLPVLVFIVKKPFGFISNLIGVFLGRRSWVGYCPTQNPDNEKLPRIKSGILNPTDGLRQTIVDDETIRRLNLLYARDYKLRNDLNICFRGFRQLGRQADNKPGISK